jgi:hypothetical protein
VLFSGVRLEFSDDFTVAKTASGWRVDVGHTDQLTGVYIDDNNGPDWQRLAGAAEERIVDRSTGSIVLSVLATRTTNCRT